MLTLGFIHHDPTQPKIAIRKCILHPENNLPDGHMLSSLALISLDHVESSHGHHGPLLLDINPAPASGLAVPLANGKQSL